MDGAMAEGHAWGKKWGSPPANWPQKAMPSGFLHPQRERRGFRMARPGRNTSSPVESQTPQLGQRMGSLPRRIGGWPVHPDRRDAVAHAARGLGALRCHYPSRGAVSRRIKDELEIGGRTEL
jgi:hypothetical protein